MFNINNIFWTFQGEGYHAGRRALFIRLPFCNYSCPWCDTEYNSYEQFTEYQLQTILDQEPAKFAVLTGGEPLMNKQLPKIIELLKKNNFYIACETNGSQPYVEGIDFVTCSPKKDVQKGLEPYMVHHLLRPTVSEYKYVVDKDFDFSLLDKHKYHDGTIFNLPRLSLSPEYNNFDESLQKIFAYIKENPEWRISLQTHKWMKIP